jgi:hypothetical protein
LKEEGKAPEFRTEENTLRNGEENTAIAIFISNLAGSIFAE